MKRYVSTNALLLLPIVALAQQTGPLEAQEISVKPAKLHITAESPFDTQNFGLFMDGFRCDADGNAFFVPLLPGASRPMAMVVRVSSDGERTTKVDLPAILRVGASDITINAIALDTQGRLHVLADVREEEGVRQHLVSFDKDGQSSARVELDATEIVARRFAVFDSGDFLLLGYRGRIAEPRAAVMPASGGSLRDVAAPVAKGPLSSPDKSEWLTLHDLCFAEPATDGRVYFAPEKGPVYAIAPSGEVSRAIEIASPDPNAGLVELRISGRRLAAVYVVEGTQPAVRWVVVHDISDGKRLASYGSVQGLVVCYRAEGSHDRFALLSGRGGRRLLLNASAP